MKDTERKYMIVTIVLALAVTFMMITGLPVGLLIPRQQISDLSEFVIPVGLDHLLCIVTIFAVLGICKTELRPKITREGLSDGIRKTLPVFALVLIVCLCTAVYNYLPFTHRPTVLRIVVESVVYYALVAVLEELLLRGLVLGWSCDLFKRSQHRYLLAVIASSLLFALGHVPTVIGQSALVCVFRFVYPLGFGMYMGYICKKTDSLLIPILYHFLLDMLTDIPLALTDGGWTEYKTGFIVMQTIVSLALCIYSFIQTKELDRT